MSTRLATPADIALLEGMLARMGQIWGETAIREVLKPPWITIIRETGGKPDGFYCLACHYDTTKQAVLGPGDGPHDTHQAWLKAICEMGVAIEEEVLRRYPKIKPADCWVVTQIHPDTMGPLNTFIETSFNWTPEPTAGPTSNKEGYRVLDGVCKEYWQKRPNLVAKAKAVLAALEKTV